MSRTFCVVSPPGLLSPKKKRPNPSLSCLRFVPSISQIPLSKDKLKEVPRTAFWAAVDVVGLSSFLPLPLSPFPSLPPFFDAEKNLGLVAPLLSHIRIRDTVCRPRRALHYNIWRVALVGFEVVFVAVSVFLELL